MALQSSGAIALDDMHVEAGGTTGSNCTINDADIRDLIDKSSGASMAFNEWYGASASAVYGRAVTFGGFNNQGANAAATWGAGDHIDYVDIASTGNASDFGELYNDGRKREMGCAGSNGSRALNYGGYRRDRYNNAETYVNEIEYITLTSTGNGQDFGNLTEYCWNQSGLSSQTRGIAFIGRYSNNQTSPAGRSDKIEYVTISSTGNSTDFGDSSEQTTDTGATGSATRGVYAAGVQAGQNAKAMEYITIASTGNSSSFGTLNTSYDRYVMFNGVASSQTRGLFMGGTMRADDGSVPGGSVSASSGATDTVEYITIASTGNGTDFGNLSSFRTFGGQTSSRTRALAMGGGDYETAAKNIIEYFTIGSTGNATDFGDLTTTKREMPANSGAHGGVV